MIYLYNKREKECAASSASAPKERVLLHQQLFLENQDVSFNSFFQNPANQGKKCFAAGGWITLLHWYSQTNFPPRKVGKGRLDTRDYSKVDFCDTYLLLEIWTDQSRLLSHAKVSDLPSEPSCVVNIQTDIRRQGRHYSQGFLLNS